MTRKGDLNAMASLVGNAAAHVALFKEEKESPIYTEQAAEIASRRSWNKREIEYFREKATTRAKSEIEKRIERYGLNPKNFEIYMERATKYIEEFVGTFMA
jgi:hypothetical protein